MDAADDRSGLSADFVTEMGQQDAQAAYDRRAEELTPEVMRDLERRVVLAVLDRKWREHLYEMDYLRDGITLRGYGQRDPLVEYQREGYDMFTAMMDGIKEESVGNLFNLQVQVQQDPIMADGGAGLSSRRSRMTPPRRRPVPVQAARRSLAPLAAAPAVVPPSPERPGTAGPQPGRRRRSPRAGARGPPRPAGRLRPASRACRQAWPPAALTSRSGPPG